MGTKLTDKNHIQEKEEEKVEDPLKAEHKEADIEEIGEVGEADQTKEEINKEAIVDDDAEGVTDVKESEVEVEQLKTETEKVAKVEAQSDLEKEGNIKDEEVVDDIAEGEEIAKIELKSESDEELSKSAADAKSDDEEKWIDDDINNKTTAKAVTKASELSVAIVENAQKETDDKVSEVEIEKPTTEKEDKIEIEQKGKTKEEINKEAIVDDDAEG